MAYVPTMFVDRSVEFPNRRKFTAVNGQADTFDVARAEGTVFAEGTKPDAANLNAEFGKIKTETDAINTSLVGLIKEKTITVTTDSNGIVYLDSYPDINNILSVTSNNNNTCLPSLLNGKVCFFVFSFKVDATLLFAKYTSITAKIIYN